jgi:hypothetical protein
MFGAALLMPVVHAQTQAAPERERRVQARKEEQQKRIAQGVASGQLTAGETAHLEHREAQVNREARQDRKANRGTLTPSEKRQVNRQQNRVSRKIYRDKHNAAVQPK